MQRYVNNEIRERVAEREAEIRAASMAAGHEEGRAEGRAEGQVAGRLETLASLVKDGILTAEDAARRAGMPAEEFAAAAGLEG